MRPAPVALPPPPPPAPPAPPKLTALTVLLVGALLVPHAAHAQWRTPPAPAAARTALVAHPGPPPGFLPVTAAGPAREVPPTVSLVWAGATGSALGFVGGALAGYVVEIGLSLASLQAPGDDPGLSGLLVGSFVGPAVLAPLAVHRTNDRQGSLPAALGVAGVIAAAGLGGLVATDFHRSGFWTVMWTVPALQVVSAVIVEKKTARRDRSSGL